MYKIKLSSLVNVTDSTLWGGCRQ